MDAARVAGGRGRPVAAGEAARARSQASLGASFAVRAAFIWPALLAILFVSIYPLLASLYISLSRLKLVRGGFEFRFVGLDNFRELLVGGEQGNFLGVLGPLGPVGWAVMAAGVALLGWGLVRAWRSGASVAGMVFRVLGALLAAGTLWLATRTLLKINPMPLTTISQPNQRLKARVTRTAQPPNAAKLPMVTQALANPSRLPKATRA